MKTPKIDKTELLKILMNVSPDEDVILESCFRTLDETTIAACLAKANAIAVDKLRAEEASALLTATFANVIIRGVRWVQLQRIVALHSGSAARGEHYEN